MYEARTASVNPAMCDRSTPLLSLSPLVEQRPEARRSIVRWWGTLGLLRLSSPSSLPTSCETLLAWPGEVDLEGAAGYDTNHGTGEYTAGPAATNSW